MKLHYFNVYGRAESLRMLFFKAKLPITEVPITYEEWPKLKNSGFFEFNQIPVLEMSDGKKLSQTKSILRYFGTQHGFYPKDDPFNAYLVDSFIDSVDDINPHFYKVRTEKDPELLKKAKHELFTNTFPKWCEAIEKRLQNNVTQKYIVGNKLTIADMTYAGRYTAQVNNPLCPYKEDVEKVVDQFKNIKTWGDNMFKEFEEYHKQRPQKPF
eukprot:403346025